MPGDGGRVETHELSPGVAWTRPTAPIASRTAYAAAHVVGDPLGSGDDIDWEATLGFRRHLWSYGLGVAEAMDTAQRGMGLTWEGAAELVRRSAGEAQACGGAVVCGVATDHAAVDLPTLDDVLEAYRMQLDVVQATGAGVVVMASRQLARIAGGPQGYAEVYGKLLTDVDRPVILHWLGAMFDPALAGYWGTDDLQEAARVVAELVADHARRIDGVKVSVLDTATEIWLRDALPEGVKLYTGDDFHYPELIRGDAAGHSHALLGIFDAIAPAASAALQALDRGDTAEYDRVLAPTVALARHVFAAPTYHYKAGLAFLAWLAGHQPGFTMLGGMTSARSVVHLCRAVRLADAAGVLGDPERAAARLRAYLSVAGIEQ
jgi:hypothetical protein